MRIIAGQYKGRKLVTAKGEWLRPTSDRNREFIFSYLGALVQEATVLDLFAGTGGLGIEALSRGARSAVFVDHSIQAVELIRKNLVWVAQPTEVFRMEARSFLQKTATPVDLLFADPPYRFDSFDEIMRLILDRRLLTEQGLLIYESGARNPLPAVPGFYEKKQKGLGDTRVLFYGIRYED